MSNALNPSWQIDSLPQAAQDLVAERIARFEQLLIEQNLSLPESPELTSSLAKVWCSSEFIAESCLRHPNLLLDLLNSGDLLHPYQQHHYAHALSQQVIGSEAQLSVELRKFRRREMVRIAWRDLAGWADLTETLTELSWLAEACIQFALAFLYQQASEKRGTPVLADGGAQQLIILGMGKLGAYELNYSSDIDLIFAYPEEGVLPDRKETSYFEFFSRLCRSLVKTLDEITVDGFVFRTDIRLRPFGDSGPVVMTFDGMEHYYQTQAREWERYAMIKARQVAGDFTRGEELMAMLRAFVYRRYLDYGAFEELRSLKMQISQELKRKDRLDNVKLGPGGIRECEFIGQAFQLIRGGTEKTLQQRGILEILTRLAELNLMAAEDAERLKQNYCFLRRLENHIQQYQDKQNHELPTDPTVQAILAYSLDYQDWPSFSKDLTLRRNQVQHQFDQVFSLSKQDDIKQMGEKIWLAIAEDAQLQSNLADYGFQNTAASLAAIKAFKQAPATRRLTSKGAGVLDRLMPQLIIALKEVANPDETLLRLLALFEAVAGRNVYWSLLAENPDALAQLIRLAAASPWICAYLALYPILFDELLDTRSLYEPLHKQDLRRQLSTLLANVAVQDLEQTMIVLRQFKHLNLLRVAAADIMGAIKLMVVSDYLTYIAEVVLEQVLKRAWLLLTEVHGFPPHCRNEADMNFAIIGFGKLGGLELGYGSDLDMVFIYDCEDGNALTNGGKAISCSQFYGRLGLKIRHILDTKMLAGILYEVDLRLRPSGDSGLLVTHIAIYEDYLKTQAWTWEHQALVRGRFIAGDARLERQFTAIRQRVLCLPRETLQLKTEVREMREKMRNHLATKEQHKFDLKQSSGGIADIEFMVQFLILAHAAQHPELVTYTDNVRLLEALQSHGMISEPTAATLKAVYCSYRDYGHKLVLQGDKAIIDEQNVTQIRLEVEQIWQQIMA